MHLSTFGKESVNTAKYRDTLGLSQTRTCTDTYQTTLTQSASECTCGTHMVHSVCVCMYVCVCVCACVCVCVCTCVYCVCMYVCVYVCVLCVYVNMCLCILQYSLIPSQMLTGA